MTGGSYGRFTIAEPQELIGVNKLRLEWRGNMAQGSDPRGGIASDRDDRRVMLRVLWWKGPSRCCGRRNNYNHNMRLASIPRGVFACI